MGFTETQVGALPSRRFADRLGLLGHHHPNLSNREIARNVGVDPETVRKARKSTAEYSAVERRVGRDGKSRPATMPRRALRSMHHLTDTPRS